MTKKDALKKIEEIAGKRNEEVERIIDTAKTQGNWKPGLDANRELFVEVNSKYNAEIHAIMMELIDRFYSSAKEYCSFIESNIVSEKTIPEVMALLMKLYMAASDLPNSSDEISDETSSQQEYRGTPRFDPEIQTSYRMMYDPYEDDEPVFGNLKDDLSDIAGDLREGINEYENGRAENAAFIWKLNMEEHSGDHIMNALKALHWIRRDK